MLVAPRLQKCAQMRWASSQHLFEFRDDFRRAAHARDPWSERDLFFHLLMSYDCEGVVFKEIKPEFRRRRSRGSGREVFQRHCRPR